jgi:hypothetical protein
VTDQEDRYSPVTFRGRERVGKGSAYLFDQLATRGKSIAPDGTFRKLNAGERYIGVRVTRDKRREILDRIDLTDKRWNNVIRVWASNRMAHRCSDGLDVLFLTPLDGAAALCPGCQSPLECPVTGDVMSRETGPMSREAGDSTFRTGDVNGDEGGVGKELPMGNSYIGVKEAQALRDGGMTPSEIAAIDLVKRTLKTEEAS